MHPIHEEEIMVKGTASVDPQEFCSIHKHTEQRGCASHSEFQSERDKVLDELEAWVKENYFKYVENYEVKYCCGGLLDKIQELRQAGEQ